MIRNIRSNLQVFRFFLIFAIDIVPNDDQFNEYYNKRRKTKKRLRKLIEQELIRKLK